MKILYVSTSTDMGGAETSLRSLALTAKNAGHTVKIISLKPLGSVGKDIISQGIEVISLNLKSKANMLENAGVFARLLQEIEIFNPDIVHALLFRAIQFCRSAKKKLSLVIDGRFARTGVDAENLDITDEVVKALDKKVSKVKMDTPKGF